jgi:hypothetical protein
LPDKPGPAQLSGAAGARRSTKVKTRRCDEDSLGWSVMTSTPTFTQWVLLG